MRSRIYPTISEKEVEAIDKLVENGYALSRCDYVRRAIIKQIEADKYKLRPKTKSARTPIADEFSGGEKSDSL